MADLVVTVPKGFWLEWLAEGDAAGEPETGQEYGFWFACHQRPPIGPGDRLYIVAWGMLRGYAPVTRLLREGRSWVICRQGGAVACTIDEPIAGFRGWREPWWTRGQERPFPDWRTAGVALGRPAKPAKPLPLFGGAP